MDKLLNYLPSVLLIATFVALWGNPPSWDAAAILGVSAVLWAFTFFVTRPAPPPPPPFDEARILYLEGAVKDLTKQLDSVKTAVNMRQIR